MNGCISSMKLCTCAGATTKIKVITIKCMLGCGNTRKKDMKSDNEKMVQGKMVVNMTQGQDGQWHLHAAFVVEAEVDVNVSSIFSSF